MRLDEARRQSVLEAPPGTRPSRPRRAGSRTLQRAGIFSPARLAGMRLARSRMLLLAVALGMLAAAVLICTVPLFNSLIGNVQLQQQMTSAPPQARNVEVQVTAAMPYASLEGTLDAEVSALGQRYLGEFTSARPNSYLDTDPVILVQAGARTYDPASSPFQAHIESWNYATAAPHMRLLQGVLPANVSGNVAGRETPQTVITQQTARELHLGLDDTVTVAEFGDHTKRLALKVVGIWQPRDANDPYWNGASFDAHPDPNGPAHYPFLVTREVYGGSELQSFTGLQAYQHWMYYTVPARITSANLDAISQATGTFQAKAIGDLQSTAGVSQVRVLTDLPSLMSAIAQQQSLLSLPLYIVVAQIVGLALLFVAAMAGLLIEGQSQEIAILKSRGVSGTQILGTFFFQGLLLAVVAAIAGPFLAALLSVALVHFFLSGSALQGAGVDAAYLAQLANPRNALLPAIGGALLGVAVVVGAAWRAARLDVLAFRREQARPLRRPFWRRYYLDVAIAIICLLGYLELGQFGTAATRLQLSGGANSPNSPLLLVTPALLLLAGALLLLRVIPVGAALGERLASRGRGISSLLAFAQVERNPSRYSRLALLLVLAVGLGLFALAFNASLQQNVHDRVTYAVGGDVRMTELAPAGGTQTATIAGELSRTPGVLAVTPVYRTTAQTAFDQGNESVDMFAIDPRTFGPVVRSTSWRQDYASLPLSTLLQKMTASEQGAHGGTGTPFFALVSASYASQFHVRVGDKIALGVADVASGSVSFVVGGIVDEFPTLYPAHATGGFIVCDFADYTGLVAQATGNSDQVGANEFWLHTTPNTARQAALVKQLLSRPDLNISQVESVQQQLVTQENAPVGAGMRGLLLVGAFTAVVLAVLASLIQSVIAARQRTTQFAILRTLGMANAELTGVLLGEQLIIYAFGLIGGTLLGLLLTTATLPFLQFSDTTVDPAKLGIPPYQLVFPVLPIAEFYAALLVSLAVALLLAARYASRVGLGKALRLGED